MWNLEPGAELIISDTAWRIQSCLPHLGRVTLVDDDGETWKTSVSALIHRPDCRPSTRTRADLPASDRGRQPKAMDDLELGERTIVELRMEHLREVETGFRNGHPLAALPHEPRPQYDPNTTTLTERRLAKVDELRKAAAEAPAAPGNTSNLIMISAIVVLVLASRPLAVWKVGLALGMLASYVLVVAIEPLRHFFRIDPPDDAASRWLILAAIVIGGVFVVAAKLIVDRIEARREAADGSAVADDTSNDST
jgi:hypothetical protein